MNAAFDNWIAQEIGLGLADIKFAVIHGKGVSVEAIQSEVLSAEAAIKAGYIKAAPSAASMMPDAIRQFVEKH